jgi:hypothetical protein
MPGTPRPPSASRRSAKPTRFLIDPAKRGQYKRARQAGTPGAFHPTREEVLVTIPPGVGPGTRLRLRGKGRPTAWPPPGDAYLAVEITDEL